MLVLQQHARLIITDSGGVQKAAFFFAVPCSTVRLETEGVETVECGWNGLVAADKEQIVNMVTEQRWPQAAPPAIAKEGRASDKEGRASDKIVRWLQ